MKSPWHKIHHWLWAPNVFSIIRNLAWNKCLKGWTNYNQHAWIIRNLKLQKARELHHVASWATPGWQAVHLAPQDPIHYLLPPAGGFAMSKIGNRMQGILLFRVRCRIIRGWLSTKGTYPSFVASNSLLGGFAISQINIGMQGTLLFRVGCAVSSWWVVTTWLIM